MDMSPAFVRAAKEMIPLAESKIVHDKFHIMKMANEAVDWRRGGCLARMALYGWGQSASSLAPRGRFSLYFRELWQLMMTSKTCLG